MGTMVSVKIIAFILISCLSSFAVDVVDGDTFKDNGSVYRIWGIDTPEQGQPWAEVATATLSAMLQKGELLAEKRGTSHGRIVAAIAVDGKDVGLMLISMGLAWHDKRFAPKRDDYAAAMEEARKARRGLWFGQEPVAPWEYRQLKRGKEK